MSAPRAAGAAGAAGRRPQENYLLQRAVFDRIRQGAGAAVPPDLPESDAALLRAGDLRGLAERDVHPVLINAFARALGITRDDYRRLLTADGRGTSRKAAARWHAS
ncbi:hypothetical protein RKE29_07735 [Streptomyces sp. B1866]|uniref:hypothetical protein n=1 Tax=Streptomyces sp. B1866 TaxID=3075431 RepID=UPI00289110BB|nr:hypothetical protein [Streptomyces sp. B1866]MDT3396532.1 hypothetical protein [Streptomyces sp. B1866]